MSRRFTTFEPAYRAEGVPAGCLPVASWPLDPAYELPGRRCPMFVQPPPRRPLIQRVVAAIGSVVGAIASGAGLMILAQYLTTP